MQIRYKTVTNQLKPTYRRFNLQQMQRVDAENDASDDKEGHQQQQSNHVKINRRGSQSCNYGDCQ